LISDDKPACPVHGKHQMARGTGWRGASHGVFRCTVLGCGYETGTKTVAEEAQVVDA
jgi:hypothetical protein